MPTIEDFAAHPDAGMRPAAVAPIPLKQVFNDLPAGLPAVEPVPGHDGGHVRVTGVAIDSRLVRAGDLYIALPGAGQHGASFTAQALRAGAVAVLTDAAGLAAATDAVAATPLFTAARLRELVGPLAAAIFNSQPTGSERPTLFGVTGTNGKTTTTYFINALLEGLGRSTGLMGTIEIHAGGHPIASALTTPESPQVHGILGLMRERGIQTAAMEVSSHAIEYRRVDGVRFDVAGFTNLTQDHLDLHGTMEEYFAVKAALFSRERANRAVIIVDDPWGVAMAEAAEADVVTLSTVIAQHDDGGTTGGEPPASAADWQVRDVARHGLGHRFSLHGPAGEHLALHSGLPGTFNISNAALATVMVLASGVPADEVQAAADSSDPFSSAVPGRMQLIGDHPAAIVDFAHNPDALARTLESVKPTTPDARLIVVFGATGQRDQTKRPVMGATAARLADVVIVTDDDPHDEDEAEIRQGVLAGAVAVRDAAENPCEVLEIYPRAEAIDRAVGMASRSDTVLIAGRGHEVWQEVKGVNLPLDDRVELAKALTRYGFSVHPSHRIES